MRARHERERESRRESIIKATDQLLNEKTFESITMDDIAIRSDFAKASIYQYFKNKEELIMEVFSKVLKTQCRLIEEKCLSQTAPVQALRNYIKLEIEFIRRYPWRPKVRATFPFRDYPADSRLLALYAQKKKLIAGIIQRGQTEGTFIMSDPDVLTNMILSASGGYANYFSTRISADLQSPEIEMFISTIIKGITKGSSDE
ncbi:TetR/AcrR family transcriptional regulator [Pelotomaculum terephthalicicum JT]|uniref:TetR/AcrR family transcriptional regulator n=1 Tax=Pelotomaculum terephthalicicum TaxID=206393 RepID=UPI0009CC98FF|nr:TetR/AcrR family transcriptional regulator [Pelotomaculum terephthalicicum]MCG9967156.1 TetR/AcrR family transcriptional regulator [Pelotomaculum terephthalicicum JT]OPY60015.1 MAG: HTH-type transcriptional regulator RutR [Pelotomaculum sp. PtaU1.Bin065]